MAAFVQTYVCRSADLSSRSLCPLTPKMRAESCARFSSYTHRPLLSLLGVPKHSNKSGAWHIEMCSFGEIESHGKLILSRQTMAAVSLRKRATSSAGMTAAQLSVLRTPFHSYHANSYAARCVRRPFRSARRRQWRSCHRLCGSRGQKQSRPCRAPAACELCRAAARQAPGQSRLQPAVQQQLRHLCCGTP